MLEAERLKSQIVVSSCGDLRRGAPHLYTGQGVVMPSSILCSARGVRLPGQQADAAKLDKAIAKNLEALGYGA